MINDLTDEIFWVFIIGCCILFFLRLLSPPGAEKFKLKAGDIPEPRRRFRRRTFKSRLHARRRLEMK
ncbi:hypothetical protein GJU94_11840 [Brucella sp. 10RB9214]|uniref:hypothetical protein n=1 Tax=unclassified Brucella TaxID=2632610 RepID=UPI00097276BE|nr:MULTISPECIES: hypothetical protein [unclassified Brucella]APY15274.1 hypothetical protein BKD02_12960 [Brucella sp. 09RB8910]MRN47794.1 hypothetical protein [Brucella sp. 10RB9212]MRN50515.1 hypothetical protein [Brucella sp. 10RB9214]